ncbi:MAG: hypothetical protein KAG14_02305 [Mycoplasmataceae bacterium]|nr:hypothetical protein [Mycoplasmataceae bacterium]
MNKFRLNTFDKTNDYEFIRMTIFIDNYKIKAKRNQIVTPDAAKIIIESKNEITSFVVLSPIIKVDKNGDANCWTSSSFDEATYREPYYKDKEENQNIKKNIKLLNAKSKLGLTPNEIIELSLLKSIISAIKLVDKKVNNMIGGGF